MGKLFSILTIAATLIGCEGEQMKSPTFFEKYGPTELGSTKIVLPNAIIGERGAEQKMIDISVDDAGASPVIVSFRVEYGTAVGTGSPVIGMIQYGVGGGETQVEFDVPCGRHPGLVAPLGQPPRFQPMTNPGGGLNVYIGGASHVSVYARNDGFMASLQNTIARANLVPSQLPNDYIGSPSPAKVIVHVQPATGSGHPKVERSIWAAGGTLAQPESVLPPGMAVWVTVPPFAKSVRIQRMPSNSPIQLGFHTNISINHRTVNLGPNDEGPIEFDSQTDAVNLFNTGAANIDMMQAVFDVTPA